MFQPDLQRTRAICGPGAGYLRDVGWSATSLYVLFAFSFLIAALHQRDQIAQAGRRKCCSANHMIVN